MNRMAVTALFFGIDESCFIDHALVPGGDR